MWVPGAFGLVMGASVLLALKDSPESLGGLGWVGGGGGPAFGLPWLVEAACCL